MNYFKTNFKISIFFYCPNNFNNNFIFKFKNLKESISQKYIVE